MKLPYHWKLYTLAVLLVLIAPGAAWFLWGGKAAVSMFAAGLVLYIVIDIFILARKEASTPPGDAGAEEIPAPPFHGEPADWEILEPIMNDAIREKLLALDQDVREGTLDDKAYNRQVRRLIRKHG